MFVFNTVLPEDEERSLVTEPTNAFQAALVGTLAGVAMHSLNRQISRQMRRSWERTSMPPAQVADAIVNGLDFSPWMPLVRPAEASLATTSRDAGVRSLWKFGIADEEPEGVRTKKFAARWAHSRAAELVGMKYVGDKLVANPNAEMAITESTRGMLRGLVEKAIVQDWSDDRLANEMRQAAAFSPERAERIARTEMNMAISRGQMIAFRTSGLVTGVRWVTRKDDKVEAHCRANEAAGTIEIGARFPSGKTQPPDHPNCRCRLAAVLGG